MEKFTVLSAVAAFIKEANIDTDKIIPARFLKTTTCTGLGKHVFDVMRYTVDGHEKPDFILNREPWRKARILITYENLGCGSSREHAVWALLDFGIRCVIAPSFADIFFNNCFKSGVLPIALSRDICETLMHDAESGTALTVDLVKQVVIRPNGEEISFDVDAFRRHLLLDGIDDIGQTLQYESKIIDYENRQRQEKPWMPSIYIN
ncbi:MAG: 3-isopropylmalate dehydratase small subunit [Acetobacter sp.]|nr:3-isopropylmalate dehydratase small subunit [Acetobacter sp.]MBQ5478639.1 3-isopropylmalate dehydratase small subunit [Acetobacter sp.]MBQ5773308.1 3-isopropylmalate dehydratase small subunit [Acetobacter sp.]